MVHGCQYTLVQTHRMCTPRPNRNVNDGLWVIMTCQCRFLNHKKWTTLVGDVDNRWGCTCVGTGGMWEVSTSPKFYLNLKLLFLKKNWDSGGQRNLVCYSPWGWKSQHDLQTGQQQQKNSSNTPPWKSAFWVRMVFSYGLLLKMPAFMTSLAIQSLRLCFHTVGKCLIPGHGTAIPCAYSICIWHSQK